MPRKPRMYLAGVPAHVVQRGNNRDVCFFADGDYRYYLKVLGQGCRRYGVQNLSRRSPTDRYLSQDNISVLPDALVIKLE